MEKPHGALKENQQRVSFQAGMYQKNLTLSQIRQTPLGTVLIRTVAMAAMVCPRMKIHS
jgi:hypothetical protein